MQVNTFDFDGIIHLSFISTLLCIGVWLRYKIPLIQQYLAPASLLAGILGLIIMQILSNGLRYNVLDPQVLQNIAFHCMNISFIAIGLTPASKAQIKQKRVGVLWLALMQGLTFPLQAIIGTALTFLFIQFGWELFPTFGFLLPLGFNEGPGQVLSVAKTWEGAGLNYAVSMGLMFASLGYFCSFLIGVPLVKSGIKGKKIQLDRETLSGVKDQAVKIPAGYHVLHSGNADTLALQIGCVGVVYLLTYLLVQLLGKILPGDLVPILNAFFFFLGLLIAIPVRWLIEKLGYGFVLEAEFQKRISGTAIDFLVISTFSAIELSLITTFLVPIFLIASSGGLATLAVVNYMGKYLPNYGLERRAVLFGTVTGTVTTGLLLLRMVDPDFKTPVALEMAISTFFVAPIILLCVFLVQTPVWQGVNIVWVCVAFSLIFITCALLIKRLSRIS